MKFCSAKYRIDCLFLLAIVMLTGCASVREPEAIAPAEPALEAEAVPAAAQERIAAAIGDDDPVTRALVAKMLAAAYSDLNTINTMDRIIDFTDTAPGMWYDKYINAVYTGGIMFGESGLFSPDAYVTLEQTQLLLDRLDTEKRIQLKMTDENREKPISYALWLELYNKLLENLGGVSEKFSLQIKRVVVLATTANNAALNQWSVVTDKGPCACVGLNLDAYIDREIRILIKDGDIIAVLAVESLSPKISNAYITAVNNSEIAIFSGGAERRYACKSAPANAVGRICDIEISGGEARNIELLTETFRDQILMMSTEKMEFGSRSALEIGQDFKVYDRTGERIAWKNLGDLTVGTDIAEFVIRDGKICAAVITKKADPTVLRVAISNSGYGGLYHESVSVSATKPFTVTAGDRVTNHNAWEEVKITNDMFEKASKVSITAAEGGKISLMGVKRAWSDGENPKYRGTMEVYKDSKGYILVNTVTMEEYLYAVVPSEMPSSYGAEASKVQAITARSYAYNQFYANRYHAYGANIDDSVSCQVYNNIPENETSVRAVDETRGQVLTYKGEVVSANFFSTSAGYTANSGEVWAHSVTKQLPAATPEYLQSARQFEGEDYGDMTDEETAARFFKDTSITAYDSDVSWFRWNVSMTVEEIAAAINNGLKSRYSANPQLIKTLQSDGVYNSAPIETIGGLKDLAVVRRGAGGNIMEMKVTGTAATVLLVTEYNVRALIKPVQLGGGEPIMLKRKDGTEVSNYSIMPSAFYTMDKTYDADGNLVSVSFIGGGNGHGAGMSQNGVKGMLTKGFTIPQILKHYYKGTEITEVY